LWYNQDMEKPKVSILVPIYNVEKFLPQCLKSLTKQSLREIEIICIDDGSTDQSGEIAEQFAKKDPRIVVIHKKNSGYGDSMNRGLTKASGEYIGIVESDDWAEPKMFEEMYKLAKAFEADVVKSNYWEFFTKADELTARQKKLVTKNSQKSTKGETKSKGVNILHQSIKPSEVGRLIDPLTNPHIFYQPPAIWSGLYRRRFLRKNKIRFLPTPGASYQDTGFNFKVLATTHRAVFTESAYLHYRMDNASSSVKSLAKVFCVMEEYREIGKFLKSRHIYRDYVGVLQATKFATYHWNMLRLPEDLFMKFYPRMQREFVRAYLAGECKRRAWPMKHWLAMKMMIRWPEGFLKMFKMRQREK